MTHSPCAPTRRAFSKYAANCWALALALSSTLYVSSASAQTMSALWACRRGEDTTNSFEPCTTALLSQNRFQVLLLPTGFQSATDFFNAARDKIQLMITGGTTPPASALYTQAYKNRFLYIVRTLTPLGGAVGTSTALFGATWGNPSNRATSLKVNYQPVYELVASLKAQSIATGGAPALNPAAVVVLFNATQGVANALPRQFSEKTYGVAKIHLGHASTTPAHELAHAFIGWLDEYPWAPVDIFWLDTLTEELTYAAGSIAEVIRQNYLHLYPIRLSEMFIAGSDNVSLNTCPSRVGPLASPCAEPYATQGAAFFEFGAFRAAGNTLMSSGQQASHSTSHNRLFKTIFGPPLTPGGPTDRRLNDRIHTAGPVTSFTNTVSELDHRLRGLTRLVLLGYDEDKHHPWQPTTIYHVQYRRSGVTTQISATPQPITGDLTTSLLAALLDFAADGALSSVLPSKARIPYQTFLVPWAQGAQDWRFRTGNALGCADSCVEGSTLATCRGCSAWTPWSAFRVTP